jgi:ATP-dependent Lhr-like helicase
VIYPQAQFESELPQLDSGDAAPDRSDAILALVTGWMSYIGPTTARRLSEETCIPAADIRNALLRMEGSGAVLRGQFEAQVANPPEDDIEWCDRRLLARIHRLTLGTLRKQVEPVSAATFMQWLTRWQHVAPGTQLMGERGLLQVVRQMQGFEIPANAWERQIIARRVQNYDPEMLDHLCLTGAVGWGRLSPHPATLESQNGTRRIVPTSVAPITFFVRDDADWMTSKRGSSAAESDIGLGGGAKQVLTFLRSRGASFFADIVRGTEMLKSEVETALWELVAAGLVTADGFDNLRALIDPKRRSGHGRGRTTRPRHSAGRWSVLYTHEAADSSKMLEATCAMLLNRYGVVFRELLARESIQAKWRELLITFRRLEDRGEVRGGRFVSGFLGEQFALPEAVDSLRAMRKAKQAAASTPVSSSAAENLIAAEPAITVSASDPLNLVGIIVPGDRVPAISGKFVSFNDGVATTAETPSIAVMEARG